MWWIVRCLIFAQTTLALAVYNHYPEVGMHYKFHKHAKIWYLAKLSCQEEGGQLAMPRTAEEAAVIKNIFNEYPNHALLGVPNPDYVLLGFHDQFEEGEFISLKGEPLQYFYHTWGKGQPDNTVDEDCLSLTRTGKLNDFFCNIPAVYVCEKPGDERKVLNHESNCPTSDIAYQYAHGLDKCYKVHTNAKKWADARGICYAEGAFLAVIRSKQEEDFLVEMLARDATAVRHHQMPDYALVGFHDLYKEGHYVTVTDEDFEDLHYVNWQHGNPDNKGFGGEDCGSMHKSGGLNDISCGTPARFVCELPASFIDARFGNFTK